MCLCDVVVYTGLSWEYLGVHFFLSLSFSSLVFGGTLFFCVFGISYNSKKQSISLFKKVLMINSMMQPARPDMGRAALRCSDAR